jgi:ferredoxin
MNTRQSRRQFLELTFTALSGACIGCREREGASSTVTTPALPQGTNSAVKWPENVAGRFFVTNLCIDCDLCKDAAPANFKRNEKEGYAFVYKQPASDTEMKVCLEAAEGCPVEAIVDTKNSQGLRGQAPVR